MMSDSDVDYVSDISTDSSDEDLVFGKPKTNNKNYLEEIVPNYDEKTFIEHFRLSRGAVTNIVEKFEVSDHYKESSGQYGNISAKDQVLIALWFIGHQTASFRDVSDRFDISVSSLYRILRRVIFTLSNLSPTIIRWSTNQEKNESEMYFRENGFPMVIGALDGCHIKIDKPTTDSDSYINRKGYYSIQMQAVCDHKRKIIDLFIGYPGSVHDSRVFRNSPLFHTLREKCGNYYILADSGYPLKTNLLTPFRDRGNLTPRQLNYNYKLCKNRYVIEHCFGILKQKFRQLFHVKIRDTVFIVHLIRAACVLHNIGLEHMDTDENDEIGIDAPINREDSDSEDDDGNVQNIRERIVNTLPM